MKQYRKFSSKSRYKGYTDLSEVDDLLVGLLYDNSKARCFYRFALGTANLCTKTQWQPANPGSPGK